MSLEGGTPANSETLEGLLKDLDELEKRGTNFFNRW